MPKTKKLEPGMERVVQYKVGDDVFPDQATAAIALRRSKLINEWIDGMDMQVELNLTGEQQAAIADWMIDQGWPLINLLSEIARRPK